MGGMEQRRNFHCSRNRLAKWPMGGPLKKNGSAAQPSERTAHPTRAVSSSSTTQHQPLRTANPPRPETTTPASQARQAGPPSKPGHTVNTGRPHSHITLPMSVRVSPPSPGELTPYYRASAAERERKKGHVLGEGRGSTGRSPQVSKRGKKKGNTRSWAPPG